ncbi:MAG: UDP-N-acetylmuramoyl-L-alanine--D-glutamate ligase [Desulfobacteraceae bacterium]|nr:MAG: UDP-N-acetylmuramoyl-L-alanine--D-glutamate ligase [Desulfobacteraceae bacterium]
MELNGRRVIVVGLARSGLAVAQFLKDRNARVTVTDQAAGQCLGAFLTEARQMDLHLELGGHRQETFAAADLIVVSPGVPHTIAPLEHARKLGIPIIGEIELASRFVRAPIVAVGGTNGKTTTTELLGRMLAAAGLRVFMGGNIGNPLIQIAGRDAELDVIVAEVSSFQLDTCDRFHPHVAVLLNITPDHLDRYASMGDYAASKGRMFANQGPEDFAVCHGGDLLVQAQCRDIKSRRLNFYPQPPPGSGSDQGAVITPEQIAIHIPGVAQGRIDLSRTALLGPHNRENIAAAGLAALAAGAGLAAVQQAVDQFQTLAHRLEPAGTVKGVHFVDDSKATNVDAVIRALECFERPVVLIMGGRNKGYDFAPLFNHVRARAKKLIVIGEARREILAALEMAPLEGVETVNDMDQAVQRAYAAAKPGDTVLLSPACASFDMFANYAERGKVFRRSVEALA